MIFARVDKLLRKNEWVYWTKFFFLTYFHSRVYIRNISLVHTWKHQQTCQPMNNWNILQETTIITRIERSSNTYDFHIWYRNNLVDICNKHVVSTQPHSLDIDHYSNSNQANTIPKFLVDLRLSNLMDLRWCQLLTSQFTIITKCAIST